MLIKSSQSDKKKRKFDLSLRTVAWFTNLILKLFNFKKKNQQIEYNDNWMKTFQLNFTALSHYLYKRKIAILD